MAAPESLERMDAVAARLRPRLPWQPAASEYVITHNCGAVFMDKRLGKCTISNEWALIHKRRNVLLVAPPSSHADWLLELEADGLRGVYLTGTRAERLALLASSPEGEAGDPTIHLTNPQGLFLPAGRKIQCPACKGQARKMCFRCEDTGVIKAGSAEATEIARMPWDAVIWDESTVALCNPGTQTNKIAFKHLAAAPFKLILSGEYAPEGPHQIFEQMRWVFGTFMGHTNFWHWRHENFRQVGYDWEPKFGRLQAIKDAVASRSFIISRKDAGFSQTPVPERYTVELPAKLRKAYDACERYMEVPWGGDEAVEIADTKYKVVSANWLAQLAGGYPKAFPELDSTHKVKAVLALAKGRFRNESLVITCRFNREVAAVHHALRENGVSSAIIWGAVPPLQRKEIQASFNAGKIRVLVMQVKCACHGVNLAKANTMLRYSLPDRYEEISQPLDRIFSPTKQEVLSYVDIVAEDTVDQDRADALADKRINARFFMSFYKQRFEARKAGKAAAV